MTIRESDEIVVRAIHPDDARGTAQVPGNAGGAIPRTEASIASLPPWDAVPELG